MSTAQDIEQTLMAGEVKMCNVCREEFPADGTFFDSDGRAEDGLRSTCKLCRKEQRQESALTGVAKEAIDANEQIDRQGIEQLVSEFTTRKQDGLTHILELTEQLVSEFGGAVGISKKLHATYHVAKPGSMIRASILKNLIALTADVSKQGLADIPLDMLETSDLERELQNRLKATQREQGLILDVKPETLEPDLRDSSEVDEDE